MANRPQFDSNRRIFFCLFTLAMITAIFALPFQMRSTASQGPYQRTKSLETDLPNYDIRSDKTAIDKIAAFRSDLGKSASQIADERAAFVLGEQALRQQVPALKVEYNDDIRIPEVIGPDVKRGRVFLTRPSAAKRSDLLVDFLKENMQLVGATRAQIDALSLVADYTNPDGKLSFVELNQVINGIPVFRGEVKAGFTKAGEIVRVINNFAPGLDYEALSTDFRGPLDAVKAAAAFIKNDGSKLDLNRNAAASTDIKTVFGRGDWATTAEKIYFPTEPGVAVAAWRVLIWEPVNAYYVIVDAATGTMLWRKNITSDQVQTATYDIYTNPLAMMNSADSPAPLSPGTVDPNLGTQGAIIARTSVTRVGNEPPYGFNDLGWMTDGTNLTDGNNVEAGLDLVAPDGVDPGSQATGVPNRVLTSLWNPPPGNPPPGDVPAAAEARRGGVIQMFYVVNSYHDELYRLGFTEAAHNFQHNNFGRGGGEFDRISAEGQDSSGTNNANFGSGTDGNRGRMQMYTWTGPSPDRDGMADVEIMIHELTHGTSNRLHGNGSGLATAMSGGMGEGWSDFYAHGLLSQDSDPVNGVYALGGYALFQAFGVVGTRNYYYGIRRFPKAAMAFTGGPNNRPHNPMTFADIDQTQANTSDGAFAPMSGPHISTTADQVHAAGEVWSSALWEVRCKMVSRMGWTDGNRRALQVVTDGMKLAPLAPTFLSERDAIIAGALASGPGADVADIWSGFAMRGMGAGASIQNAGTGAGNTRVTEAFNLPNLVQTPQVGVSDLLGDNDGAFEPGETLTLTVPLTNITGTTATGVSLQVVGGSAANYGTINSSQTVSQPTTFLIPPGTPCGSALTLTFDVNSSLGPVTFMHTISIGAPTITLTESFDGLTPPSAPPGWTITSSYAPMTFVSVASGSDTAPNSMFAADLPNCTTGCPTTNGGSTELISPPIPINASAATVSFRHKFNTEVGWDGGVLEISIAGGPFQDIVTAGGGFVSNGYNAPLGVNAPNPLGGRNAWTGDSGGYITSIARMPAAAGGQNVHLRWRLGTDNNTAPPGGGWNVDTISVTGSYTCSFTPVTARARADFDADGRTDVSVYRPAAGDWYVDRSAQGLFGINFGIAEDIPTPGDFDGDNKADIAVWRPSTGTWYRINSAGGAVFTANFGLAGDIPQAGDFDGDEKDDIAVFRPSSGTWYWQNSGNGQFGGAQFGQNGDLPVAGDYDGDGHDDLAVFRPSTGIWYRVNSSNGAVFTTGFGLNGDMPVNGNYDGDNREDIAVFRPSDGTWYWQNSGNGQFGGVQWGQNGDIPVPGDYDGDGLDDVSVYRGGTWYLKRTGAGPIQFNFGLVGDIPIPKKYIP